MCKIIKFDDPSIEKNVLKLLKETEKPVSVDYVAFHIKIGWGTARSILLNMALKGTVKAIKTTKSLIFQLPNASGYDPYSRIEQAVNNVKKAAGKNIVEGGQSRVR